MIKLSSIRGEEVNNKNKSYLRDYIIKGKKEKLRRKSVEAIIQENFKISEEEGVTLRAVISPADYPYDEQLDFNPFEFKNFFNQLINRIYSFNKENQSAFFFDPQGSIIDYSAFLIPIHPDKWMSERKSDRFNNIMIKQDGVILFITSQNVLIDNKVILDLKHLSRHLEILFTQIIPEIYEKMNYEDRLNIDIDCFGLSDSYLQIGEYPENVKLPRDTSSIFSQSYILNLQNPIKISDIIILDIRRLFEF